MSKIVPIGEAKARLSELVRDLKTTDVVLVRRSRPAAVLVDYDRFEALIERLEDAEDALAVHNATGDTIDADDVEASLGLKHTA